MIKFKTIRYRNFLSAGNVFTEIRLDSYKTTLIVGENGAGKSTLLDAIFFALFNKAYRNINKPQLVNSLNKKELEVELDFTIGANDYMVRRGVKPNIFEIFINGVMLPQDAASDDSQDYLERFILRMNEKSFRQICILGAASFKPFMSLVKGDRREVIEDILDLQIFTIMNGVLKDRISETKGEISDVDTDLKIIVEKIALQEKYIQSISKNTDELIAETEIRLESYRDMVFKETQTIINNNRRKEELMEGAEEPSKLSARLAKIKDLNTRIEGKIKSLNKEIEFYHDNETCPTCRQGIDHVFKDEVTATKRENISEAEVALNKILEEMATTQEKLDAAVKIYDECSELNIQNSVANQSIREHEKLVIATQNELVKLQERKASISNMDEEVMDISLPEQLASKENQKSYLLKSREIQSTLEIFLKDSGVKTKIIKKYIPIINKYINKYLAAMEFAVTFELDSTFKETIKSRHRDEFSYESFSEGEKARINLAILFTWREIAKMRNSAATNLLIFDEIFDGSLDGQGSEEFMKILNAAAPDTNIVIISHKTDVMLDKFDRTIRFRKVKNYSEAEEI